MAGKDTRGLEEIVEQHLAGTGWDADREEVARGMYRVIGLDPETSRRRLVLVVPAVTASVTVEDIEWLVDDAESAGADIVEVTAAGTVTDQARQRADQYNISVEEPDSYQSTGEAGQQQPAQSRGRQQPPQQQSPGVDGGQSPQQQSPGVDSGQQPPRGQAGQPRGQMPGEGQSNANPADMLSSGFRPVGGFLYGLLGFILSFTFTTIYFFYRLNEITDGNIDAVLPDEIQAFGWAFYNANMVDITVSASGASVEAINYLDRIDKLNGVVFYGMIALMLFISGYSVASRVTDPLTGPEGAVAGASVVVGYLPLLAAGTFLFTTEELGATAGPEVGGTLLLWGIIYSVVFGGIGGYLSRGL